MKIILSILLTIFLSNCSANSVEGWIFQSVYDDTVVAEKERKKCEDFKKILLLTIDLNKDKDFAQKVLLVDCFKQAHGYPNPNTQNNQQ